MKIMLLVLCLVLSLQLSAEEKSSPTHSGHADEPIGQEKETHAHNDDVGEESHADGDDEKVEGHEEAEEASSNVGPGNAVTAADPERGLQLSPEALQTLKIGSVSVPANGVIPKSAIVTFKDEVGVYRLRDGWFKLVEGSAKNRNSDVVFIPHRSSDLRSGDSVVVHGAPLLRVAELDAFSTGEAGHGH